MEYYEYVLFRCKRIDSKNYIYFPILKRMHGSFYEYYRIRFIPKKKLTKNTIRFLSDLSLIEYFGSFASDDGFFDYYYTYYSYGTVYNYKIIIELESNYI